jgi:hypothetical protein
LGDAMQLLTQDKSALPFGIEMRDDQKQILMDLFFINKINLPPPDREMTAYEVSLRNKEFIRNTMPLFEPIEDYNAELCEKDFTILMRGNAFGSVEDIPRSLLSKEIQFRFQSPLQDAMERQKADRFGEAIQLIAQAIELEPTSRANFDAVTALRDALNGIQVPAKWLNPEELVQKMIAGQQQLQAEQIQMKREHAAATVDQQRAVADQEIAASEQ